MIDATWRYACSLNQEKLHVLGAWRHPATGRYHSPSGRTEEETVYFSRDQDPVVVHQIFLDISYAEAT